MVTTEQEREHIIEAINQGARNYLIKPFLQEELIARSWKVWRSALTVAPGRQRMG